MPLIYFLSVEHTLRHTPSHPHWRISPPSCQWILLCRGEFDEIHFWAHTSFCLAKEVTKYICIPRFQGLFKQKPGFGSQINFFSEADQENNHKTMFDCTGQLVNNLTAISSYGYISYYFICQLYLANYNFSLKMILGKIMRDILKIHNPYMQTSK